MVPDVIQLAKTHVNNKQTKIISLTLSFDIIQVKVLVKRIKREKARTSEFSPLIITNIQNII